MILQENDLKIKYMYIQVKGKVKWRDVYSTKKPEYDRWIQFVDEFNSKAPKGLNKMIIEASTFVYMMQERAFVTSALQGIGISISFAFVVLIIATRNIIQSILSIFCVSMVIVSTVAIMNLNGWELGVAESVAVVVQIGLSVDYVVHLSTDYMHSPHRSRNDKMRQSFK